MCEKVIKFEFLLLVIFLYFLFLILDSDNSLFGMSDDEFLDMVQRKCFDYFWNTANPDNGLIPNKANNSSGTGSSDASIAAVGFGLTAICIGHSKGWISYSEAYNRILTTLNFFKNSAPGISGFYYHYLDIDTGERYNNCEVSTIDTALFLTGALFAGQYFKGTQIETIADELYQRANWQWMQNTSSDFISMGWKPEEDNGGGFTITWNGGYLCIYEWNYYNEGMLLDVLAIGSPTYPPNNSPNCWINMGRPTGSYGAYNNIIYCTPNNPLFIHQYPQLWVDLRRREYNSVNYYTNSIKATLANRQFCIDQKSSTNKTYSSNCWGLTACDSASGYKVYGAPPCSDTNHDGTVAPTAAGGSVMFTPKESIACLKYIYNTYKDKVWDNDPSGHTKLWGKYGFADAFNLNTKIGSWCDPYVLGIDQGAILISIENYMTGMVWDIFMLIPYIEDALKEMGFIDTDDNTRPGQITDLKADGTTLKWTAPGDDGYSGRATKYIIKYLNRPINSFADWYDADIIENPPAPSSAGTKEEFEIPKSLKGCYFAIRAIDDKGNKSPLSNSTGSPLSSHKLFQNYPNPFNPDENKSSVLPYFLTQEGNVKLYLYTLNGKLIKEWDEGSKTSGRHQIEWDGKNKNNEIVSPGIYVLILEINNEVVDEKKIVVIR